MPIQEYYSPSHIYTLYAVSANNVPIEGLNIVCSPPKPSEQQFIDLETAMGRFFEKYLIIAQIQSYVIPWRRQSQNAAQGKIQPRLIEKKRAWCVTLVQNITCTDFKVKVPVSGARSCSVLCETA